MPEKTYYILNQKNDRALESVNGELQLNKLDKENPNQLWKLEIFPDISSCYYIIHSETNKALKLSATTAIREFHFQLVNISKLIKKSPDQLWLIKVESEGSYTIETSIKTSEFKFLCSPKSDDQDIPPVFMSDRDPEKTYCQWILQEVSEEPIASSFEILATTPAYVIREMCKAIADAQRELDAAAMDTQMNLKEDHEELHDIGYQVTWYQIPEATLELKVAVHLEITKEGSKQILVSPYNASYKSQFKFTADGSSNIKLRVVPIPPPIGLGEKP